MRNQSRSKDLRVQEAFDAYHSNQYFSISKVACTFKVFYSIMKHHVAEKILQTQVQKPAQNLSNAEEIMFVRWITHFMTIGFPISPKLMLEMVEEIHCEHVFFASQVTSTSLKFCLIGYNWLTHFKQCNLEIFSIWIK